MWQGGSGGAFTGVELAFLSAEEKKKKKTYKSRKGMNYPWTTNI